MRERKSPQLFIKRTEFFYRLNIDMVSPVGGLDAELREFFSESGFPDA